LAGEIPIARRGFFTRLGAFFSTAFGAKPGQANPSPAKPIQIKLLGFAWFYSSESGLIKGLQRIPNKNFSPLRLRFYRQMRLAGRTLVF
jgi:hypothetical protein